MNNKTLFQCIAVLFCGFLFYSCQPSATDTLVCQILKVELKPNTPSVHDLFSSIEVVSLDDRNDSCLVMQLTKVLPYKDKIYVLDRKIPACYEFDRNGNFIRQIGRAGNGPGEYIYADDCLIDEARQEIVLMECFGFLYVYDMTGKFLRKVRMQDLMACHSFALTSDGKYALWNGASTKDQSAIGLFDFDGNLVKGCWHQPKQFNWMLMSVFYNHAGNAYFSTGYSPVVYEVSADTLQAVYQWDFGENSLPANILERIGNEDERHGSELLWEYLDSNKLPYRFRFQFQNSRYYYVQLVKTSYAYLWYDIFYDKQTGHSFVFDKVKEGFSISPLAMTDEYMLCLLKYEDFDLMKEVLPEDEYAKLTKLDEESNPCLLRLYFK
jgi:hypothetical protein